MKTAYFVAGLLFLFIYPLFAQHIQTDKGHDNNPYYSTTNIKKLNLSDQEWKKILSPNLYAVAR